MVTRQYAGIIKSRLSPVKCSTPADASDSGDIQEEAPALGKPVLVMREVTERPEGVWAGTVKLVGTNRKIILAEVKDLMEDPGHYQALAQAKNPYGDGCASQRIVAILGQQLRAI